MILLKISDALSSAAARQYTARIHSLLDKASPVLRRTFLDAVSKIQSANTLKDLAAMLEQGRYNEALGNAESAIGKYAGEVNAVYVLAGRESTSMLSDILRATIDFNQVNQRAVSIMQADRLELIRQFTTDQINATRLALTDGIERGLNPIAQARAFRASIGLTSKQMQAVINYRSLLEQGSAEALQRQLRDRRFDSTVMRAINGDNLLTKDQIDRMVQRYQERLLQYRSQTIARTESLRAVNRGAHEAILQARDQGKIDTEHTIRTWITAHDERVRPSHAAMNGQQRSIDAPFKSGLGNLLMYPGDPSAPAKDTIKCRCTVTVRVVRYSVPLAA